MHLWWGGGVEEQMHNVDYDPADPSWRQTLRLPLPRIELRSPASEAGTLPKELSRQLTPVLRIRDFYPRSRILDPKQHERGEKKLVVIKF